MVTNFPSREPTREEAHPFGGAFTKPYSVNE